MLASTSRESTHLSGEWHEVMLAQTEHVNVSDNDHLVVVLGKDGVVDDID